MRFQTSGPREVVCGNCVGFWMPGRGSCSYLKGACGIPVFVSNVSTTNMHRVLIFHDGFSGRGIWNAAFRNEI